MIRNHFKIAWRNIKSNKTYSGINITGLSIGLAAFLLIATVVINEMSYDHQWSKGNRIYRLVEENTNLGEKGISTASPLGPQLIENFEQVETSTEIYTGSTNFKFDNSPVELTSLEVNPGIWNLLDLQVLQGNPQNFTDGYLNLVITEKIKKQYFPNSDPVGKIVKDISSFGSSTEYYISGIIKDLPMNTHLRSDVLVIQKPRFTKFPTDGFTPYSVQYLMLKPGVSASAFMAVVNNWYKKLPDVQENREFSLQPMEDIYLKSDNYFQKVKGNQRNINILTGVAILLLLIACINFVNLSTARTLKKIKNTGLRKVLGASRKSLIAQFLAESFLFFGISYLLGLGIYYLFLPYLEGFLGNELALTITGSVQLLLITLAAISFISLLTGIYPAWTISKPNASNLVSNSFKTSRSSEYFRKGLVVTQFVITIGIIVATLVVNNQLKFLNTKDLGFNKENLLFIKFTKWGDKGAAFEKEIKKIPGVENASIGQWIPSSAGGTFSQEIEDPQSAGDKLETWYIDADKNLFSTLELQLVKGRDFRNEFSAENVLQPDASEEEENSSDSKPVLITEFTAERLNIDELNKPYKQLKGIPVGIVKNFHNQTLRNPLAPTIIRSIENPQYGNMLVRVNTENPQEVIGQINKRYNAFFPENLFNYSWISNDLAKEFRAENKLRSVLQIFSLLIVFLSCLGLFGFITFMIQNRTKEISIRKVLGASVTQIVSIFSRDSLKLILLSAVISIPVAWYLLDKWLADFPYRIEIVPSVFIQSALVVLIIAMATIGIRIVRAAFRNPADNLRTE
ncbi:putative ABC transport system permease protein [Gillisia sp. Hel1_33_143]|uniref:ABC transporter permease n=1 Tax=Gillisia sp. Hel1_33_143 TaxID=1336796 RepID=UPI0008795049|nr:ABC transporter permease [Gillisia sp. Hel1_33_143]SDS75206.1 putative ABC transport system permease protein [Gillisia sp. Hel1_33_143]